MKLWERVEAKVVAEDLERSRVNYDREISSDWERYTFSTYLKIVLCQGRIRTTYDVDVLQTQAFQVGSFETLLLTQVQATWRIPTRRPVNFSFTVLTFECDELFRTIRSACHVMNTCVHEVPCRERDGFQKVKLLRTATSRESLSRVVVRDSENLPCTWEIGLDTSLAPRFFKIFCKQFRGTIRTRQDFHSGTYR